MTSQIADKCIYLGMEYAMPDCLTFPSEDSRIVKVSYDEASDEDKNSIVYSNACWRNYIATWEIKNDCLYIKKLEGKYRLVVSEPILADWFTGDVVLPQGELIENPIDLDFELIYEKEITLTIVSGIVTQSDIRENF